MTPEQLSTSVRDFEEVADGWIANVRTGLKTLPRIYADDTDERTHNIYTLAQAHVHRMTQQPDVYLDVCAVLAVLLVRAAEQSHAD